MPSEAAGRSAAAASIERLGRGCVQGLQEIGYAAMLGAEALYWLLAGPRRRQPVRLAMVAAEAVQIGLKALPIITVLGATIGVILSIQGIYTLRAFGAESQVVLGIALSVAREFAPLITGILVAGRSGSSLAARLGTMKINQEIDALQVMGINPVRYLVGPPLLAMLVMLPALTMWSILVGLIAAGAYVSLELGMSFGAYLDRLIEAMRLNDVIHGVGKSALFGVLIALIGVVNGVTVQGGAEGVGRATTRAVVVAISAIVITDMIFVFVLTRA